MDWGVIPTREKGAASLGFNVGFEYRLPLVSSLSLLFSGDAMYNGLISELKDAYETLNIKTPNYINVPVMAGLNYDLHVGSNFAVFVQGGAGLNMRFMTPLSVPAPGVDAKFDPAFTFAFQGGAGFRFAGHYSVGVNYYVLGKADVKSKTGAIEATGGTVAPEILTIRLGYDF